MVEEGFGFSLRFPGVSVGKQVTLSPESFDITRFIIIIVVF